MMLLRDLMLADLECASRIVQGDHEVVPAWRILAPDGDFVILTRLDPDKPEHAFALMPRLMGWKLATAFVLTAETWLGPERTRSAKEAILAVGVSRGERLVVVQRIRRAPRLSFGPVEWLPPDAIDDTIFRLLPSGVSSITAEKAAMLAAVFGEEGEEPRVGRHVSARPFCLSDLLASILDVVT